MDFKEMARLDQPDEITEEQRNKLIHFNTKRHWHCYYDPKTDVLYNEYCKRISDNAYQYLLDIGLIDKNRNKLGYFQEEDGTIS